MLDDLHVSLSFVDLLKTYFKMQLGLDQALCFHVQSWTQQHEYKQITKDAPCLELVNH